MDKLYANYGRKNKPREGPGFPAPDGSLVSPLVRFRRLAC
ncbi:hypothetical protein EMIT0215P_70218 [Pseudomonas serboccidentalis]